MQRYKFAATSSSDKMLFCYNDTIVTANGEIEAEGTLTDGLLVSAIESFKDESSDLSLSRTANEMTQNQPASVKKFESLKHHMFDSIVAANDDIFTNGYCGCDIASVTIKKGKLAVTNLGACAAFILHAGKLERLTDIHVDSVSGERTRYIGYSTKESLDLPIYDDMDINSGDVILLCSSGIYNYLNESEIANILIKPISLQKRIDEFRSGIHDDVAIAIIEIGRDANAVIGSYHGKTLPEITESPLLAIILTVAFILLALAIIIINNNRVSTGGTNPNYTYNPGEYQTPYWSDDSTINPGVTDEPTSNPLTGIVDGSSSKITPTPGDEQGKVTPTPYSGQESRTSRPTNTPYSTPVPTYPPGISKPTPTDTPLTTSTPTPELTDKPVETEQPVKPTDEPVVTDSPKPTEEPPITEEPPVTEEPTIEPMPTLEPIW